ncbi:fimbrial protein [Pseudomonas chlororaphis]|uniref:fimbrial protein n=1 Tax=Pseudomonas chlororaphis TaxID=587753 RepID=UPI000BE406CD|nr:fimbrial protein [Pseudomonas chlororaphis]
MPSPINLLKKINHPLMTTIMLGLMQTPITARADTDTGIVTITGTIVANTCVLKNKSPSVDMGSIKTSDFQGAYSEKKKLSIELENCGQDVDHVNVTFTGTAASETSLLSAGEEATAPKNVGIQLLNAADTPIDIGAAQPNTVDISSAAGAPTSLEYKLRYKKIGTTPITAGAVNTTLNFELSYQ